MSKRLYLQRHHFIIRKLQKAPATFKELREHLEENFELLGDSNFQLSQRTFIRDRQEILQLYSISIEFDFKRQVYYIEEGSTAEIALQMLQQFEMLDALKMSDKLAQYIFFEKRQALGTEHFSGMLKAIRQHQVIKLTYQKFYRDNPSIRMLHPYALKESQGRWYLVAMDKNEGHLKTYALDRIVEFEPSGEKFKPDSSIDVNRQFQDYFGVFTLPDSEAKKICLSFYPGQGKFIKTYPLHSSQKITADNDGELEIELYMHITPDFEMELLRHAGEMEVISPVSLKKSLNKRYAEALKLNS